MNFTEENLTAIRIAAHDGAVFHGDGNAAANEALEAWAMKGAPARTVTYASTLDGIEYTTHADPIEVGDLNETWGKI